jgi:hypothetical protein
MATYNGVTGIVTAGPGVDDIVAFVEADIDFGYDTGEYIPLGTDVINHMHGKKVITGTLKRAWGPATSTDIIDWFNLKEEKIIHFDIDDDDVTKTMIASGCILTNISVENMTGGGVDQLLLNCPFKGRDWTFDEST